MQRRTVLGAGILGGLGLFFAAAPASADALDDGSFRREVIDLLAKRRPKLKVTPSADPVLVKIGSHQISLKNLFAIARDRKGEDRALAILDFFDSAVALNEKKNTAKSLSYAKAKPRLLPQLVPSEYQKVMENLVMQPFYAGLSVAYALDDERTYELVQADAIEKWGIDQTTIDKDALANLSKRAETQVLEAKHKGAGAYVLCGTDDGYAAARILLPQFLARVRQTLNAPKVCLGIPNRDFLLAWTPDFENRKGFAAQIAHDAANMDHPFTDSLFVSTDEGLRLMKPDELADHGR